MRRLSGTCAFFLAVGIGVGGLACNTLSGADALSVSTKTDQVDSAPIEETDSGYSNTGSSGGHGGTTPGTDSGVVVQVEASTTDATGLPTFFDDFARPDGTIGNGWMLKTASKYTLSSGSVKQTGTGIFADLVNRRPTSEDNLNSETSVTVVVAHDDGDPSVFSRIQPGSDANDFYQSYAFYPGGLDAVYLEREDIDHSTLLASVAMSPNMVVGTAYRITLKVTGTSPVHLEGTLETTTGTRLASIVFDDNDAKRIQGAGSTGFGSGAAKDCRFDDFKRVNLP